MEKIPQDSAHPARARRPYHGEGFRKRLEEDCLLGGELHPSIAERLQRVRELPVSHVANLLGVERDERGVWLVWRYIDGIDLQQLMSSELTAARNEDIARQLRHAAAAMHAHGIVHGAIHARNVIIDPRGRLHLTHVSPYLHCDPAEEDRAIDELLSQITPVAPPPQRMHDSDTAADRSLRRRGYLMAVAAIVGGILIFVLILWYIRG